MNPDISEALSQLLNDKRHEGSGLLEDSTTVQVFVAIYFLMYKKPRSKILQQEKLEKKWKWLYRERLRQCLNQTRTMKISASAIRCVRFSVFRITQ